MSAKCQKRTLDSGEKFKPYDPGHDQPNKETARECGGLPEEQDADQEGASPLPLVAGGTVSA